MKYSLEQLFFYKIENEFLLSSWNVVEKLRTILCRALRIIMHEKLKEELFKVDEEVHIEKMQLSIYCARS